MLRSLKERGLTEASLLAIGDGALGLWAALDETFPTTRHQRCCNHRKLNVLDKLPKRLHPEVRTKLRALAEAPTRQECERRRDGLCAWLRARGQERAAACLGRFCHVLRLSRRTLGAPAHQQPDRVHFFGRAVAHQC